jgi:hypothetical protein
LSRVINPDSAGKERNRMSRGVVLAIRELMKQAQPDAHSRDLAAFIALALIEISKTIDVSVAAWEKRGYWVKADRFRMDWAWAEKYGNAMRQAVLTDDWAAIAATAVQIAQKLGNIKVPVRHRLGEPWQGAREALEKR